MSLNWPIVACITVQSTLYTVSITEMCTYSTVYNIISTDEGIQRIADSINGVHEKTKYAITGERWLQRN